jgi:hypothetical protein
MRKPIEKKKAKSATDIRPDAWDRFEQAVDVALHTPAPHKPTKSKAKLGKLAKAKPSAKK